MIVSIPRETAPGEARVALVPEVVARLTKAGATVVVEASAGARAGFPDDAYRDAGAQLESDLSALWSRADALLKVQEPREDEIERLKPGAILLGLLRPSERPELLPRYQARGIVAFALERVPRTSRAQKMDALSAMSTIAGYKAVLLAAARLPRFFPLLMTAAGTIPPARVFILGAGVAGLSAIATARRLGAVVEAFDIRPAVREEVQSLGATFVGPGDGHLPVASAAGAGGSGAYAGELSDEAKRKEQEQIAAHVATADVVITTALVPGRRAPLLVTEGMVRRMKSGAVVVDLAAEAGGNCALMRPGEEVDVGGVTVLGPLNLPATVPGDASRMYARTIAALFLHLVKDGAIAPDFDDDIVRASCIARPEGAPA